MSRVRKRVFLGLLAFCALFMGVLGLGVGYWLLIGPASFHRYILFGIAAILLLMLPLAGISLFGLVLAIWHSRPLPWVRGLMSLVIDILFPVAVLVGRLFGFNREAIHASFLEVNNQLVGLKKQKIEPRHILVLLPHCLQWIKCPHKITLDLENCRGCGKCSIVKLLEIRERLGIRMSVATGGGQARRVVADTRPHAIVAVACERELAEGVQDVKGVPVFAIPNLRPEGYCRNTQVDPAVVSSIIERFLGMPLRKRPLDHDKLT